MKIVHWATLVLIAGHWITAAPAGGQSPESLIKAALIFKLTKVVDWTGSGGKSSDHFLIGHLGTAPFDPDYDSIMDKPVGDSRLEIVRTKDFAQLSRCHILFISESEEGRLDEILAMARKNGILTISEISGFAERGGVIQIIEQQQKLGFLINTVAAEESSIHLSSQLLKIATILESSR